MRIVFLGSDAIALPALEWLVGDARNLAEVVGVFTQPDRAVGRGQRVQPNAVKTWALGRGLPVLQPSKLTGEVRAQLADLRPDLSLVMAYGHILKDDFIATPTLGTVNLHASILPRFRGASPIQSAIAAGEAETGVTLMRIVRELDAGPVAEIERVPVGRHDTAADMEAKLAACCVPLLARTLPALSRGALRFTTQDHSRATFCRRLQKADGLLDFSAPAARLAARINGLFPWPGCVASFGGHGVRLGLAEAVPTRVDAAPGTILGASDEALHVATGAGILRLLRLQRPGGRMLTAGEFLRGFPVSPGQMLLSHEMAPLVASKPFR